VCIDFSAYVPIFGKSSCSYISLYGENVQEKYRNRVLERSFSPLFVSVSAIIAK